MAKVKVCLDDACARYYFTDDGKAIVAPRDVCDFEKGKGKNPKSLAEFKQRFNKMARNTTKTVFLSEDPEWNEGDDTVL